MNPRYFCEHLYAAGPNVVQMNSREFSLPTVVLVCCDRCINRFIVAKTESSGEAARSNV